MFTNICLHKAHGHIASFSIAHVQISTNRHSYIWNEKICSYFYFKLIRTQTNYTKSKTVKGKEKQKGGESRLQLVDD